MHSLILLKDPALSEERITFASRRRANLTLLFPFQLLKSCDNSNWEAWDVMHNPARYRSAKIQAKLSLET